MTPNNKEPQLKLAAAPPRCFTCVVPLPNAGYSDRMYNLLMNARLVFCKEHFDKAVEDRKAALMAHPGVKALVEGFVQ